MFIHRQFLLACALACGTAFVALGGSSQEEGVRRPTSIVPSGSVSLEPCEVSGTKEDAKEKARCGTYEVFENRAAKSGRTAGFSAAPGGGLGSPASSSRR